MLGEAMHQGTVVLCHALSESKIDTCGIGLACVVDKVEMIFWSTPSFLTSESGKDIELPVRSQWKSS